MSLLPVSLAAISLVFGHIQGGEPWPHSNDTRNLVSSWSCTLHTKNPRSFEELGGDLAPKTLTAEHIQPDGIALVRQSITAVPSDLRSYEISVRAWTNGVNLRVNLYIKDVPQNGAFVVDNVFEDPISAMVVVPEAAGQFTLGATNDDAHWELSCSKPK